MGSSWQSGIPNRLLAFPENCGDHKIWLWLPTSNISGVYLHSPGKPWCRGSSVETFSLRDWWRLQRWAPASRNRPSVNSKVKNILPACCSVCADLPRQYKPVMVEGPRSPSQRAALHRPVLLRLLSRLRCVTPERTASHAAMEGLFQQPIQQFPGPHFCQPLPS